MRKLSALFIAAILMAFLPVYSEAEVLSKIKATDFYGNVKYYDNFGSLMEDMVIFKKHPKQPATYYPGLKNSAPIDTIKWDPDSVWIEFDVLPTLIEGKSFGKGSNWLLGIIYVPMQYIHEMRPYRRAYLITVETGAYAIASPYKINAEVGRDEKIFLTFYKAISDRMPLRVAGWLRTYRYTTFNAEEVYSGYIFREFIGFNPVYAVSMWWARKSSFPDGNSRGALDYQSP